MFTGIVEEIGIIKNISLVSNEIAIFCRKVVEEIKLGDSIAVNGICLSVKYFERNFFIADVMPETFRKTNLNQLKNNDKVNLERALKINERINGHLVSGHIDGTGILLSKKEEKNAIWLSIEADKEILKYIVFKGSVALDGVSLTIAYVDEKIFKVSLIPITYSETIFKDKKLNDKINIECDILGKYVEKFVLGERNENLINKDFLSQNGFF